MTVTHTTQAPLPNHTTVQAVNVGDPVTISANAYNENHTVTPFALSDILTSYRSTVTVFAYTAYRVVTHGLGVIPHVFPPTPHSANGTLCFITNITATQFTINLAASQDDDNNFDVLAVIP